MGEIWGDMGEIYARYRRDTARPSLDVLQQLVKAQREDVKAIIEEEARQIDHLKEKLDAEVRTHADIEPHLP